MNYRKAVAAATSEQQKQPAESLLTPPPPLISTAAQSPQLPEGTRICSYSLQCRLLNDAEHVKRFSHPSEACEKRAHMCGDHQFAAATPHIAHRCAFDECDRYTVAKFNHLLCGYHARMLFECRVSRSQQ